MVFGFTLDNSDYKRDARSKVEPPLEIIPRKMFPEPETCCIPRAATPNSKPHHWDSHCFK